MTLPLVLHFAWNLFAQVDFGIRTGLGVSEGLSRSLSAGLADRLGSEETHIKSSPPLLLRTLENFDCFAPYSNI